MRWVNWALNTALQCHLINHVKAFLLRLMHSSVSEGRENAFSVVIEPFLSSDLRGKKDETAEHWIEKGQNNSGKIIEKDRSWPFHVKSSDFVRFISIMCRLCPRCFPPPSCQWMGIMCSCVERLITSQGISVQEQCWCACVCACAWVCVCVWNRFSFRSSTFAFCHYVITI